jgi:uncharacterized protein YcfL
MKKISILILTITVIVACKSKKAVTVSSTEPTEHQLSAVKAKIPDATMDQLKKGHSIFYGACTNCHGAKNITNYTEQELAGVLDQMAPKAKLSADEKEAVWRYALAVRSK